MLRKSLVLFVAVGSLAGCVGVPHPGSAEGAVAPRIVLNKQGIPVWQNVESFGPVRSEDRDHAGAVCATLNNDKRVFEAAGYHSRAIDVSGAPFPGGGYYCVGHKAH